MIDSIHDSFFNLVYTTLEELLRQVPLILVERTLPRDETFIISYSQNYLGYLCSYVCIRFNFLLFHYFNMGAFEFITVFGKVRAIHIMLDRRTTIMALIECTELHTATTRCQQSRKLCMSLKKILNQAYSNSPQQYRLFHHHD